MRDKKQQKPQAERLREAAENLKRIEKVIAPFIPKEKPAVQSTAGKWREMTTWTPTQPTSTEQHTH
ncbi:MAG: hypothetical protein AB1449_03400 [Chloroflexota bacterium]